MFHSVLKILNFLGPLTFVFEKNEVSSIELLFLTLLKSKVTKFPSILASIQLIEIS